MHDDLKGKTAVITGAGKEAGIGFGIAKKLASLGTDIVIADLGTGEADSGVAAGTEDEMVLLASQLEKEFNINTLTVNMDVTDNDSISKAAEKIKEKFNTISVLCNNAGASFGVPNTVENYDEGAWLRTIDVNLHGVFKVTRGMLPLMKAEGGSIINTASRAGKTPGLFNGAYSVAKAGVIMLTKVMALEMAGMNIRVNAICPGQIMTDLEKWRFGLEAQFFDSTAEDREKEMCKTIPLNRIGTAEEVGSLVAFLASKESSYITGQAVNITGGQLVEL